MRCRPSATRVPIIHHRPFLHPLSSTLQKYRLTEKESWRTTRGMCRVLAGGRGFPRARGDRSRTTSSGRPGQGPCQGH